MTEHKNRFLVVILYFFMMSSQFISAVVMIATTAERLTAIVIIFAKKLSPLYSTHNSLSQYSHTIQGLLHSRSRRFFIPVKLRVKISVFITLSPK